MVIATFGSSTAWSEFAAQNGGGRRPREVGGAGAAADRAGGAGPARVPVVSRQAC